jgi:hypothetical protein
MEILMLVKIVSCLRVGAPRGLLYSDVVQGHAEHAHGRMTFPTRSLGCRECDYQTSNLFSLYQRPTMYNCNLFAR